MRARVAPPALALVLVAALLPVAGPVAAQQACTGDAEPNDTEIDLPAAALEGPICLEADLPAGDQDLLLWDVTDALVTPGWDITLDGVTGTLTVLRIFPLASPPGQQPVVARQSPILEISIPPESTEAAAAEGVIVPVGSYLLGVTRSGLPGGGEPAEAGYRLRIEPTLQAPAAAEVEPNDDGTTATPVTGTFEVGGDLAGSSYDVFGWTVDEPGLLWDVDVRVPLEASVNLEVVAEDGRQVGYAGDTSGARLHDLALAPGRYDVRLSPGSDTPRPYVLRATPSDAVGDAEPNDETALALPIADGVPARGRLGTRGDRDRYRLSVPAGDGALRDVRLIWRSDQERRLCLLDAADQPTACRGGVGGAALSALSLAPGEHVFEVTGTADPTDPYALRVDVVGPAPADFEAEPNDDVASATTLDPAIGARGRGDPGDRDIYRLRVDGEPQLWQLDLAGEDIEDLTWTRPNGVELDRGQVGPDGTTATLTDLYLVPGVHWFGVRVDGPEYALAATTLGPPDPDGEREPNGDRVLAETYRIGQRRVGRLPTMGDVDVYRFTLAAPGHVRFDVAQPADGAIDLWLRHGDEVVAQLVEPEPGSTLSWDLALLPGDHLLELRPSTPSEGRYELTSEQLDPFRLAADQEPNDDAVWAREVPASLSWEGAAGGRGDQDWYRLPPLTSEPLRILVSDPDASVRLRAGDTQVVPDRAEDGAFVAADVPPDIPVELAVIAKSPYHVGVSGGGLTPNDEPPPPGLDLAWELPPGPVAAYWPEAQRLEGGLRLRNRGAEPLDLHLATSTSHYLWTASLAERDVTVGAGQTIVVPASVSIAADAWADEAVLVSARAETGEGGAVSGTVELIATAGGPPTGTGPSWSLPEALLGGLDAAYTGFGAVPGGDVSAEWEPALFDGVVTDGGGFAVQASEMPIDLTVDLAGDAPISVAGIVLDPLARDSRLSDTPDRFEVSLSLDGADWQPALEGRLEPLPIEQSFVLDRPQDARFARLRILSRYGGGAGYVALGEWKVVAEPGVALTAEALDIADPLLGGHVVSMRPFSGSQESGPGLLDAELRREAVRLEDDPSFELIVGFQDDRAARIEGLEWEDPNGSDPTRRLESVTVSVSTQTPLGPWADVGTWPLVRASDGSVAAFDLTGPTWARFVRLSGEALAETTSLELPGRLRVVESAPDETYRSMLGEWGEDLPAGPFERLVPAETMTWDPAQDAPDDPPEAAPLAAGPEVTDRVEIGVDEDWYAIDVPPTMSGLEITLRGQPTVGVALTLLDPSGAERPMALARQPDGSVSYQARVEPGQRYRLGVDQPPFSAVFAFDTSGSMGPFLDIVMQGMRTFAAEVRPGREAVMIVPFEDPPLLPDWEADPYVLQDAVNNLVTVSSSSGAEAGLLESTKLLTDREGARAVLLVTDAETSTFMLGRELWDVLAVGRPIVFAVHIGATGEPVASRQLMQDWAASGGGHYTYPSTHGAMDRAFDRMATWLRRPAVYSLRYEPIDLDPGSLSVVAPADGAPVAMAPGVGVEIILDTSGSMRARLAGERRIDIAKESLDQLVDEALPDGVPVALRAFGGRRDTRRARCQTRLIQPLAPLDRAALRRQIAELKAVQRTATPIAAALAMVTDDLSAVTGTRSIVLITDGDETCDGDPAAAIAALREAGVDVAVNIVGFALDDPELKARMAEWADSGGGTYFDAAGADELVEALGAAIGAPIRIYGPDGEVYEGGTVGGGPIELDPGTYRVEILSDPPFVYDEIVVAGGEAVELVLPEEGEEG